MRTKTRASTFPACVFPVVYCGWLVVSSASAFGQPLRIAVVERINESAVDRSLVHALRKTLVKVGLDGSFGNAVTLRACEQTHLFILQRSFQGACGRKVRFPMSWNITDPQARFFRGVINGPNRPAAKDRQALVDATISRQHGDQGINSQITATNLPSDMVLMVDGDGVWHWAADWNADLLLSSMESFELTSDRPQFVGSEALILAQTKPAADANQDQKIHFWTIKGSSQEPGSSLMTQLARIADQNTKPLFELVWLDCSQSPASFSVCIHQAKDLKCDFVVANLGEPHSGQGPNFYGPVKVARLLAEISAEMKIPVLVNLKTSASPNFLATNANQQKASVVAESLERLLSDLVEHPDKIELIELPSSTDFRSSEKMAQSNLADAVSLSLVSRSDLPAVVVNSAAHFVDSAAVHSWWYRSADRHGSIESPVTFHEPSDESPWPRSHLSYREFFETGRSSRAPIRMGDSGFATPQRAWILVQAPAIEQNANWNPPRLFQSGQGIQNPQQDAAISNEEWKQHYDHDRMHIEIKKRSKDGMTPAQILGATKRPNKDSTDITVCRRYLLALDHPSLRKQHLQDVIDTSQKVLSLCEIKLGRLPPPRSPYSSETTSGLSDQLDTKIYAWAVDAAYRRVRAIGYRELPEVVRSHPITDWNLQEREFVDALSRLSGMVDIKDPRFVLSLVRHERRRMKPDVAIKLLHQHAYEGPAMPWYFKKERDLWSDSNQEPLRRLGHARWFLRQTNQPVID